MNFVYLVIEIIICFLLMGVFYKISKKDGLYLYLGLMGSILSIILVGNMEILKFQVSIAIPVVMSLFICNNVIIHRYGLDEVGRILKTFCFAYVTTFVVLSLSSLICNYRIDISSNNVYDLLFGYMINNIRCIIGGFVSTIVMLLIGSGIYYSSRKNRNTFIFSNLVTAFVICFVECFVFVLISYVGIFDAIELFGMISVRYIMEVLFAVVGLIPAYILIKFVDRWL